MRQSSIIQCCLAFIPSKFPRSQISCSNCCHQHHHHHRHQQKIIIKNHYHVTLSSYKDDNNNINTSNDKTIKHDTNNKQFKKSYAITGKGTKSLVSMKTNTGHEIQTDIPKQMGGTDKASQPVETLLAAWMGCTQVTAIFVGRNMEKRVIIDSMDFDIKAWRDERGALGGDLPIKEGSQLPDHPARLEKVEGVVKVYAKARDGSNVQLTNDQLCILGMQTERRCPVGTR